MSITLRTIKIYRAQDPSPEFDCYITTEDGFFETHRLTEKDLTDDKKNSWENLKLGIIPRIIADCSIGDVTIDSAGQTGDSDPDTGLIIPGTERDKYNICMILEKGKGAKTDAFTSEDLPDQARSLLFDLIDFVKSKISK